LPPLLDDVSFSLSNFYIYSNNTILLTRPDCFTAFSQGMVELGTRFAGYRDEAETLRGKISLSADLFPWLVLY
jgi:hypothetical protein